MYSRCFLCAPCATHRFFIHTPLLVVWCVCVCLCAVCSSIQYCTLLVHTTVVLYDPLTANVSHVTATIFVFVRIVSFGFGVRFLPSFNHIIVSLYCRVCVSILSMHACMHATRLFSIISTTVTASQLQYISISTSLAFSKKKRMRIPWKREQYNIYTIQGMRVFCNYH
jgi:hypothetical protein